MDYGGTIDSNGVHWGELLWTMYQRYNVPVSNEAFRQAYVFGERALALQPLVKPDDDFLAVLQTKLVQQFTFLNENHLLPATYDTAPTIQSIAAACDAYAAASVEAAKPVLENLGQRYPLVLVSNFYGNVNAVLRAYGIHHFFQSVVESSVVGVRKPDPKIFALGAEALQLPPSACLAVGDSYRKDMEPARKAGCQTVWLKGEGWEEDPVQAVAADAVISSFQQLLSVPALNGKVPHD